MKDAMGLLGFFRPAGQQKKWMTVTHDQSQIWMLAAYKSALDMEQQERIQWHDMRPMLP